MCTRRLRSVIFCVSAVLFIGSAAPAPAQSVWIGGGTTGEWSNPSNWLGGPPVSSPTTAVIFTGGGNLNTNQNISNPLDLNSLAFDVSAGPFVITNGGLRFQANGATAPSLTKETAATITFANPVTFSATGTIGGGGTGSIVFGPLTVAQGTLNVARSGVSADTLTVQAPATIAPASATSPIGTLTVGSTATLQGTYAADVGAGTASDLLAVGGALNLGPASTLTISGTPSGGPYTLATYASRTGTFATVNNLPPGYLLVYGPTSLVLVPEPAMILVLCAGAGVVGWCRRDYRSRRTVVA